MESSSAKDLAVLVANKVTLSQLHLMAAEEMSLTLGCMSRNTASLLSLLLVCRAKHVAYLHNPADAPLCVAISFQFHQVQSLIGLRYSSAHPRG